MGATVAIGILSSRECCQAYRHKDSSELRQRDYVIVLRRATGDMEDRDKQRQGLTISIWSVSLGNWGSIETRTTASAVSVSEVEAPQIHGFSLFHVLPGSKLVEILNVEE